jgi:methionyl-tRNA formyltransferase
MNAIFFGTPDFARIILEKLIASPHKPALVVTAADKPVGKKQVLTPPAVKVSAQEHGIAVLQPRRLSDIQRELADVKPDVFVVAAYGEIMPQEILDIPQHGALNVHPSLLPKYRGASPLQGAILAGEEETGVSIMLMDEQMDHGPVLAQRTIPLPPEATAGDFFPTLATVGADMLLEVIPHWIAGTVMPKPQSHAEATYTERLKREDGHVDWHKPARHIARMLRAYTPWPGIYTLWRGKRLKILSLDSEGGDTTTTPALVQARPHGFAIQAHPGLVLPREVQLAGKKAQSAEEFVRGYPDIIGSTLS